MVENSKIEWTDHTFNPWIGCTKVSPGCDNCYAETLTSRFKTVTWGPGQPRSLTGTSYWQAPHRWNKEAAKLKVRPRVFCASLADVFDNEVPPEWRQRLWRLIAETPHLDWLLLTKRIGNAATMWPAPIDGVPLKNVWLGISVVNQEEINRDIPKLLNVPAQIRFLSMEPLLGYVHFSDVSKRSDAVQQLGKKALNGIDWVIVGGESGAKARPMHPAWARSLRDQCVIVGVPFFFKQWGEYVSVSEVEGTGEHYTFPDGAIVRRVGKKLAGRTLDGVLWNQYPKLEFEGLTI